MKINVALFLLIFLLILPINAVAGDKPDVGYSIVIDVPRYSLTLMDGEVPLKTYPIAVGKPAAQTPTGSYSIINKAVNPTWHPNSRNPVPPGPANPLGIRWLGFYGGYGIHGNNDPSSIGKSISLGCIRMYNYDVSELYSVVGIGIPVEVVYGNLIETFGEEAVVAYRDIYSKEKGFRDKILEQLTAAGILEKIPEKKLENMFLALRNGKVAFAENWILTVNGEFLTSDTIYDRTMIFVNCDSLNEFFGISIEWNDAALTGRLMGRPISAVRRDGKLYASIADVAAMLGGRLWARVSIEELNYEINFAKLDGRFLTSDVGNFKVNPDMDLSLLKPEKQGRVNLASLEEEGFTCQIHSKYGYIEIMHNLP